MSRLDDIRKRLEAATDGPWFTNDGKVGNRMIEGTDHVSMIGDLSIDLLGEDNALFISSSPTDIAHLLKVVDHLEQSIICSWRGRGIRGTGLKEIRYAHEQAEVVHKEAGVSNG